MNIEALDTIGKTLVGVGVAIAALGLFLWIMGRHDGRLLPGDIVVQRRNVQFYFPVVTCLVVSAILSLIAWLVRR